MKHIDHKLEFDDEPLDPKDVEKYSVTNFLRRMIQMRRLLVKAAVVGAFLGIVLAFSMPKKYTVHVILSPEIKSMKASGGLASMAASFLGTGLPTTPDALNALHSPMIVSSTPFLLDLLKMKVGGDAAQPQSLDAYLETESRPWWMYVVKAPRMALAAVKSLFVSDKGAAGEGTASSVITLDKKQYVKLKNLRALIDVEMDSKTALTRLSVTLQDPYVAAVVADSVVERLQRAIIQYRTSKAQEDLDYWQKLCDSRKADYYEAQQRYARFMDAHNNVVLQSTISEREKLKNEMNIAFQVYGQVVQQLQMAQAKVQEEKPVFATVEPAVVPIYPSSMSRTSVLLGMVVLSVMGTLVWKLYGLGASLSRFVQAVRKEGQQ